MHENFVALDVPAFANGLPVLLAAPEHPDGVSGQVIALTPDAARAAHAEGWLKGWTPNA